MSTKILTENLLDLYSQKILSLAMEIPLQGEIPVSNGHATRRSPICGSQIEAFVLYQNDEVKAYQQIVKTCALGQASAAIFGKAVIGRNLAELEALRFELHDFLANKSNCPATPFDEYQCLIAAREYPNRHASILIAVDVCLDAINLAKKKPSN